MESFAYLFLRGQVLNPNGTYAGQKPKMLVSTNTTARMPRTTASAPVTTLVYIRYAARMAARMRIVRSMVPMFFFIVQVFGE